VKKGGPEGIREWMLNKVLAVEGSDTTLLKEDLLMIIKKDIKNNF
jgi:hypothetical protein